MNDPQHQQDPGEPNEAAPDEERNQRDKRLSEYANNHAVQLREHFDSVVIICSRHDGAQTAFFSASAGNWHARYGATMEYLRKMEAYMIH